MRCIFWWEWVDSNHLSRKTTDLQSAPALQLRRTPTSLVRAAGIEPAFQAWKACILALELCSQQIQSPMIISYFFPNASIYSGAVFYSSISTVSMYLRETDSNFTGWKFGSDIVSISSSVSVGTYIGICFDTVFSSGSSAI